MEAPSFRLDGKVALITGATGGIGLGIVQAFAASGARIVLVGRRVEELKQIAADLKSSTGVEHWVRHCDVTDWTATSDMIADLPALDIVVNNAGTNIPEPIGAVSPTSFDAIFGVNVRATFAVCQAAVARMKTDQDRRARGGSIINISSQMGHVGSPNRTVYCASKHAVEGLTKALALELASDRIRVNSLAPTFVDTPLIRRIVDTQEKYSTLVSRIPMGSMATVKDILGAAIYLASPASSMVTGTSLVVDGGWTAQ